MSLRPEEVKEKGSPKDRGDSYSNKDIVRRSPDEIIVVDRNSRMLGLDGALLVNIIYWKKKMSQ